MIDQPFAREDGFYWVKLDYDQGWQPAKWEDGWKWLVLGEEEGNGQVQDRIIEVGPRIDLPENLV